MVIIGTRALGICQRNKQDDDGNGGNHLDQGGLQVGDGSQDQLGAVVDGDHRHPFRQARPDLLEFFLDPFDDIQGVLALPHHHDAGNHLAGAVKVRDPAALVRPQGHRADILDTDRTAGLAGGQQDVFEIGEGFGIAASADHVLGAAEFDQSPRRLVVAAPHRIHHVADGKTVGLQAVGIDVHLVLFAETADGSDLGDSGDRLQVVAQIPVLVGAEFGQAVLAGFIHQGILKDPAQAGGIGAELGFHSLRQPGKHA